MTANLILIIAGGALVAAGVYLVLERSIMRILAGLIIAGNGVNVLFLAAGGPAGHAPIIGSAEPDEMADPLPQAMVLTAIVISLAVAAFMTALSYRSFQLDGNDEVPDDMEDAIVRRRAEADLTSEGFDDAVVDVADSESGGLHQPEPPPSAAQIRRLPDGSIEHDEGSGR